MADSFKRLFQKRLREAVSAQPGLRVSLVIGDPGDFPKPRDYAYSAWDGKKATIVFAPKIYHAPRPQQEALIRHELSHALLQTANLEHSERECDALAEQIFGDKLYYDAADIQTLDPDQGVYTIRPHWLPR
jgi:Zn-dependent peptidase ImmA (M78 family)